MRIIALILLLVFALNAKAQDLNAQVQVISPRVQNNNKRALIQLESAIRDFLNGRRWTGLASRPQERIDCNFLINISEWDGSSSFKAEAQIQSSRPVFGTTYNSPLINISDKHFDFSYIEGQALDFSEQQFQSNIASLLAYYAYIIVGFDADSFSRYAGARYFEQARQIVNNAQNVPFVGWRAVESQTNRYWLSENLNNQQYNDLRNFIYEYHRDCLDILESKSERARKTLVSILPGLQKTDRARQGNMLSQIVFTAKSDEIVHVLRPAPEQDRLRAYSILSSVDPVNIRKYDLLKSNQ
ncbi:uncharacterized protein DUF4835 [Arcticibacter pallidicorallinus]|uniref:Uncharacterized protein DUF4835 n=1 Tax=Arcticibacter pallidicorallinus TaxID=1259464 RepID=A0A2T0TVZ4_9SPHI|nr:DUF4835 family protein [Arcticibacter pallidicorallinus]PRY49831.1 uncharacterized protein DUF4835 [Arcticibacter pallidicorallinus]